MAAIDYEIIVDLGIDQVNIISLDGSQIVALLDGLAIADKLSAASIVHNNQLLSDVLEEILLSVNEYFSPVANFVTFVDEEVKDNGFTATPEQIINFEQRCYPSGGFQNFKWTIKNQQTQEETISYRANPSFLLNQSGWYDVNLKILDVEDVVIAEKTAPSHFLIGGGVSFVIKEGQTPISNATVMFNGEQKTTNSEGIAIFYDAVVGQTYLYSVTSPYRPSVNDSVLIDVFPKVVEVFMQPINVHSITFQINDTTGSGINNVNINIPEIAVTKTTQDNGTVVFSGLTPGSYNYTISKTGFLTAVGVITIEHLDIHKDIILLKVTKSITQFSFLASKNIVLSENAIGIINESAGTITVDIKEETNITSLTPTIVINGDSISPQSGVAQDFTSGVNYLVTSETGETKEYVVTINFVPKDNPAYYGLADDNIGIDFAGGALYAMPPSSQITIDWESLGAGLKYWWIALPQEQPNQYPLYTMRQDNPSIVPEQFFAITNLFDVTTDVDIDGVLYTTYVLKSQNGAFGKEPVLSVVKNQKFKVE